MLFDPFYQLKVLFTGEDGCNGSVLCSDENDGGDRNQVNIGIFSFLMYHYRMERCLRVRVSK